jgi:hypothetical protein
MGVTHLGGGFERGIQGMSLDESKLAKGSIEQDLLSTWRASLDIV